MSAYTADLAGCKITVYFYKMFSAFFQLVSKHEQKLPVPVILYPFPKVQALRTFPSDSDLPHILHHIFPQGSLLSLCWKSFLWFFIFS